MDRKRIINLIIGPALFLACGFLLPEAVFTTFAARAAVGTIAWMAYWWITAPIDYAVTGFLPIAINAICQLTDILACIQPRVKGTERARKPYKTGKSEPLHVAKALFLCYTAFWEKW